MKLRLTSIENQLARLPIEIDLNFQQYLDPDNNEYTHVYEPLKFRYTMDTRN